MTEPSSEPKPASSDLTVEEAKKRTQDRAPIDKIIIHPFPKVVLLWPVMIISLLWFFLGGGVSEVNTEGYPTSALVDPSALGWWWMVVFFFNLLVHTFDFGRNNFIATLAVLGVGFLGLWVWDLQSETDVYGTIYHFFGDQNLNMHPNFYAMMAAVLAVLMLMAFITTRFNYWVLAPNQLTHKHGILGDERHYATIQMSVEKEIPDVFEFMLFGSGRLIFKPGTGQDQHKSLVVDNVFRVNKLESKVREFLGIIKVDEDRFR
ncbi:MAG: hypothetical protein K8I27_15210 [Planctomycetes bacterium]|nr:hypothetical protein [Planctomycetota bacterium]